MTEQVYKISHAQNRTRTTTKNRVSAVTFPTSSNTGSPVNHCVRNRTQLKLFSAALGYQRVHILAFVLLGLILGAVIFLLPTVITPPTQQEIAATTTKEIEVVAPPDSPWSDAQLAKQRREAQETLSKVLEMQSTLEDKKVNLWAKQGFAQAIEMAATGDDQYRQRLFEQAQSNYIQSKQMFEALLSQVDGEYQTQTAQGLQAIEDNQSKLALDSYQLALYLKPESGDAQEGLKRAQALDQVIVLVDEGKHLMKVKKFTDAKNKFDEALKQDAKSAPAQQQLVLAKQAIKDENFSNAMSDGFTALNQKAFKKAIDAFTLASKIRPNAKDAAQAVVQAKNSDIEFRIADHYAQARALEKQEQWEQANGFYSKMMALDKSVIKARIGGIRTQARAKLDKELQSALDKPERLTSPGVFAQSKRAYAEARRIKKPGNKLTNQLSQLNKLLNDIQQPIAVKIQSNNQTNVTLNKVGSLGSFTAKSMDLKPGKYTLIGTRNGYRDVRREFTLLPNKSVTTIVVQCVEKISNG
jgi:tetratricopeptide (TPR) repeat protein